MPTSRSRTSATSSSACGSATIAWLIEAHRRLVADVVALAEDGELDRPRRTNWGEEWRTRSIIGAMITHDAYHAGEINHLRSVLGDDDRWFFIKRGDE